MIDNIIYAGGMRLMDLTQNRNNDKMIIRYLVVEERPLVLVSTVNPIPRTAKSVEVN